MGGARGGLAAQRMEMNHTLREIGRSLRAIVDERKDRADAMLKAANATPEQEAKIRAIFRELGSKAGTGEPSEQERGAALRKVLEILTPEQREAVLKEIRR
jgi:Spy/CpxP family protein refolding chaperone